MTCDRCRCRRLASNPRCPALRRDAVESAARLQRLARGAVGAGPRRSPVVAADGPGDRHTPQRVQGRVDGTRPGRRALSLDGAWLPRALGARPGGPCGLLGDGPRKARGPKRGGAGPTARASRPSLVDRSRGSASDDRPQTESRGGVTLEQYALRRGAQRPYARLTSRWDLSSERSAIAASYRRAGGAHARGVTRPTPARRLDQRSAGAKLRNSVTMTSTWLAVLPGAGAGAAVCSWPTIA